MAHLNVFSQVVCSCNSSSLSRKLAPRESQRAQLEALEANAKGVKERRESWRCYRNVTSVRRSLRRYLSCSRPKPDAETGRL